MQMINCSYFLRLLIEFAFATLGKVTSAARSCNSWWQLCDLLVCRMVLRIQFGNGLGSSLWLRACVKIASLHKEGRWLVSLF